MKKGLGALALTLVILGALDRDAAARVTIDRVVLDFGPGATKSQDLILHNDGDQREYVLVGPREIVGPGTPSAHAETSPDPGQLGLLVTPRKLVLDPGQRRVVRVVTVGPRPARDRIYRLHVRPVVGAIDSDAPVALKVLLAYDVLVIVRPDEAVARPHVERRGRTLVFTNDGNTNALASPEPQCDERGGACVVPQAVRVYAGSTQEVQLPHEGPATYTFTWLDQRDEVVVEPGGE